MTDEVILNSGYKEHKVDKLLHPYADKFFQKRFKDEKGRTKYFIDVLKYNCFYGMSVYDGHDFKTITDYEYELYTTKKGYACKTKIYSISDTLTIEEIEQAIDDIWSKNGFDYYDMEED